MAKFNAAQLRPGKNYCVVQAFQDYDGILHPAGEAWQFLEQHFLPYEDGLTLRIKRNGQEQWLRLQWRDEAQGKIIDAFSDFVEEV